MVKNLKKYKGQFNKIGKKERLIIFSILLASFAIGIAGSYVYKNLTASKITGNTKLAPSPTITLQKTALLTLISDIKVNKNGENEVAVGGSFDVTLKLNSANQGVEAADFIINFDPDYVKGASVSTGTFFQNYPIKLIKDNFVKVSGIAQLTEKSVIVPKGEGTIAIITFETLEATSSTKIGVDKVKTIIASGGQNILDSSKLQDLQLKISE